VRYDGLAWKAFFSVVSQCSCGPGPPARTGHEETLTVLKLGLPATLRRSLSTTNSIENLLGTVRRVTRNVNALTGRQDGRPQGPDGR